MIEFSQNMQQAVTSKRFHHQWLPDEIFVEKNFAENVVKQLEQMGYKINARGTIGRTDAIMVMPDKTIEAVGDHRGDDAAAGY